MLPNDTLIMVFEFVDPMDLYTKCNLVCNRWCLLSCEPHLVCSQFCWYFGYEDHPDIIIKSSYKHLLQCLQNGIKSNLKLKCPEQNMHNIEHLSQVIVTNYNETVGKVLDENIGRMYQKLEYIKANNRMKTNVFNFIQKQTSIFPFHIDQQCCQLLAHLLKKNRFFCFDISFTNAKSNGFQSIRYKIMTTFMSNTVGKWLNTCLELHILPGDSKDDIIGHVILYIGNNKCCEIHIENCEGCYQISQKSLQELRTCFFNETVPDREKEKLALQFLLTALFPGNKVCKYFSPLNWKKYVNEMVRNMDKFIIIEEKMSDASTDEEEKSDEDVDSAEEESYDDESTLKREIQNLQLTSTTPSRITRSKKGTEKYWNSRIVLRPFSILHKYCK